MLRVRLSVWTGSLLFLLVAIGVGGSEETECERGVQVSGIRIIMVLASREEAKAGGAKCKNGVAWKAGKRYIGIRS